VRFDLLSTFFTIKHRKRATKLLDKKNKKREKYIAETNLIVQSQSCTVDEIFVIHPIQNQ
jgi:hypothetical protein